MKIMILTTIKITHKLNNGHKKKLNSKITIKTKQK